MKKRLVLFFVFLLLANIFINIINSEDIPADIPGAKYINEENFEKIQNTADQVSDSEARSQYLKQEWKKILEKSQFGKYLLVIDSFLTSISPLFELFLGIPYTLSFYFFIALCLFIGVVIIIASAVKNLFHINIMISIPIAIVIGGIAGQLKIYSLFLDYFSPIFTNPWIIIIAVIIGVLIVVLSKKFLDDFGKALEKKTKEELEKEREQNAKTADTINKVKIKGG